MNREEIDLVSLSEQEQEAYRLFEETYELQNPPPSSPVRIRWKDAGILYILKFVTTIAAVALAAMRTAGQFYLIARMEFSMEFSYAQAIFAFLGIEGGLVVLAADKAIKRGKSSPFWINLGIILMIVISLLAGLGQSLQVIPNLSAGLHEAFAYTLAIGLALASIVAYIGGEVIGQQINELDVNYQMQLDLYQSEMEDYKERKKATWNQSPMRRLTYGEIKVAAQRLSANSFILEQNESENERKWPPIRESKLRERVFSYLEMKEIEGEHPGQTEIHNDLGISLGSADRYLKEYREKMSSNGFH